MVPEGYQQAETCLKKVIQDGEGCRHQVIRGMVETAEMFSLKKRRLRGDMLAIF